MKRIVLISLVLMVLVLAGCQQPAPAPEPSGPTAGYDLHVAATKHASTQPELYVHHYCKGLPSGVMQCQLYDNDADDARLIGAEMIVPNEVWETFSEEEKPNWHGHVEELEIVDMQTFGMTGEEVAKLVEDIGKTHGKVIIFWDPAREYPDSDPAVTIVD